jgi:hypothetical protein
METEKLKVETDENGTVTYRNAEGELHNPYGPALIWADGDVAYYIKGRLHNENGPAIVHTDGSKEYYNNGNMLSEAEFNTWQAQLIAK